MEYAQNRTFVHWLCLKFGYKPRVTNFQLIITSTHDNQLHVVTYQWTTTAIYLNYWQRSLHLNLGFIVHLYIEGLVQERTSSIVNTLEFVFFAQTHRCDTVPDSKFHGPTWGPPGSCRPQMGPMLAPWTLLSGVTWAAVDLRYPTPNWCEHIEAGKKCLTFCRQYFQMHFVRLEFCILIQIELKFVPSDRIDKKISNDSGNGMAANRRIYASTWLWIENVYIFANIRYKLVVYTYIISQPLPPNRRRAITCTNAGWSSIGPLGT